MMSRKNFLDAGYRIRENSVARHPPLCMADGGWRNRHYCSGV